MKVLGISFTISTLLGRAAQSIRAPVLIRKAGGHAEAEGRGREVGHGEKMADGHGAAYSGSAKISLRSCRAQNGLLPHRPRKTPAPALNRGGSREQRGR